MFALPGSLLWLFLLIYFACGQILDITSSDISNKRIDDLATAINHTSFQSNEEKNKNNTAELETKDENKKSNSHNVNRNLSLTKSSKSGFQQFSNGSLDSNKAELQDNLMQNSRKRTPARKGSSNPMGIPMMSQERRNSYLSIAERRKYYNRTREQTKKSQFNAEEVVHRETESNLTITSTEAVQVNEIRVVKRPMAENSSREIKFEKNQTSGQTLRVNSLSREILGKPQTTRQSVIQSQYQFGQKLNLKKSVSLTQDIQEERLKRRKEKSKIEFFNENNTNKLNKNYPTLSTKLIRVDKYHWATTTLPQVYAENENFVMRLFRNETILEKIVDLMTTNNTEIIEFSDKNNVSLKRHNLEEKIKNQTKVPQPKSFNPLPLSNLNATEKIFLRKNITVHEKESANAVQNIQNEEILKLNDTVSKLVVGTKNFYDNSVKNLLSQNQSVNNNESHSTLNTLLNASEISDDFETTTLLKTPSSVNTDKINLMSLFVGNKNFSDLNESQSVTLKTDFKDSSNAKNHAVGPSVKATSKESSPLISRLKIAQTDASLGSRENISQVDVKNKNKDILRAPSEAENLSKTVDYPLTIELNENNKRVLNEMFQTLTTPKPKKTEAISQSELRDIETNGSAHENGKPNNFSKSQTLQPPQLNTTHLSTTVATAAANKTMAIGSPFSDDNQDEEDYNAQGTQYNTKFYISPKLKETKLIRIIEEDEENDNPDEQERSAGVAIYVLSAFGMVPLLVALIFGAKFIIQRNHRQYECESDAKSDVSANESQIKDNKKNKGATNLKKSPSNVTTITLVTATRLPRVQHWEDSEKQGNRHWEFPRSKIKLKTILGQGNFGQVWKAEAEDMPGHEGVTRVVAVKTVKEGATEKEHTEFIKELEIMQQIGSHPNIVTLLGCCTDQEPYYLIMEFVKHGKLLTYLREHRVNENYYNFSNNSDDLTSRDLTVFAYCVARGMEYLASRGIIHRDLAARNVLVDHNKLCKIADFGMSRSVRDFENGQVYEERQQKGALPIRWMAPESLIYSVFTYKSDVWSFGILMWEIVTLGSTPYPNLGAREVMRKVRDGYRLERPSHCKPEFYRLISYCWAHDPNKRPDFSELRRDLGALLDNPMKDGSYVDLDRFAVNNNFHISPKTNDFRLLDRNEFKTLQKLGDWEHKDWPKDVKKMKLKKGNNGKGTVTLTGQGSFTVNSRILEKEFKII